jgi:predicted lipoprotein with Yx(FWY)xxD motif
VATADNAKLGKILVDAQGMTLYFFDRDANGTIACVGACATKWPPFVTTGAPAAPSGVTGIGTASRPDGTTQVTYKTHPLYRFSGDAKAGDTNGDGFAGIWHAGKVTA